MMAYKVINNIGDNGSLSAALKKDKGGSMYHQRDTINKISKSLPIQSIYLKTLHVNKKKYV